jgi:hypothetical protein
MDEIFPGVILWLMLVFVAIVGGLVSFRSSIDPHARPLARTKWMWLGMLLIAAGVMAAFFGFGWAWMASMEGASEVPGALMFFSGLGGTFIGMLEDGWRPAIGRNTARSEVSSHRRAHAPHRERAHPHLEGVRMWVR